MVTFAYPALLLLLLLVPGMCVIYIASRLVRKKKLKKFGNPSVISSLMPDVSKYKAPLKFGLLLVAFTCLIISLARPWGGLKNQDTTRQGIEVVIAVDASNSMLASSTGNENDPDRMKAAKLQMEKLISRLGNDRVGLIAYTEEAYTLIPVTNDYVSAKTFLNSINPSEFPHQGTNIANAIRTADHSFSPGKDIGKAIILITDAEQLENKDEVMKAVKQAAKRGIQVDVLGVGTDTPSTIPFNGQLLMDPSTGEPVQTKLDEELAAEIANSGRGIYVNASNPEAIDELEKQLDKQKKVALESSFSAVHDELFVITGWIALVLLLIELMVNDSKNSLLGKINFFKKNQTSNHLRIKK